MKDNLRLILIFAIIIVLFAVPRLIDGKDPKTATETSAASYSSDQKRQSENSYSHSHSYSQTSVTLPCEYCNGKGFVTCRVCDGTGKNDIYELLTPVQKAWTHSYCEACDGSGTRVCGRCNGAGKY